MGSFGLFGNCGRASIRRGTHRPLVNHHANGGYTTQNNMVLLCAHHHRLIHHTEWQVHIHHGKPEFTPPEYRPSIRC